MSKKLIRNSENIEHDKITLFCFPFAGGGASTYNNWVKMLDERYTVCPIQLPGREDRIAESPYYDMNAMLNDLESEIMDNIDGKFAFWGHSMGGKIAYELEKRLEKKNKIAEWLFISASRAPCFPETDPIHGLPDLDFKHKLSKFDGTPKEIMENDDLLDFFLPMLRADFTMDETYCGDTSVKLQCPVSAFAGDCDKEATEKEMKAWSNYTKNEFEYRVFHGSHFYIKENEIPVLKAVADTLKRITKRKEGVL